MTDVVVPVSQEGLTTETSPVEFVPHPWTGGEWGYWSSQTGPLLATPDEDATYGQIVYPFTDTIAHGVATTLGPWTPPFRPVQAWVDYQGFSDPGSPVRWRVNLRTTFSGPGSFLSVNTEDEATAGWRTGSLELGFINIDVVWGNFVAAVASASLILQCNAMQPSLNRPFPGAFRVSWLRLRFSSGEAPPLRQFHRSSGGMTPPRASGGGGQADTPGTPPSASGYA